MEVAGWGCPVFRISFPSRPWFHSGAESGAPGAELFPGDPCWLSCLPGVLVHLLLCVSVGGLGAVRHTVRASVLLPTSLARLLTFSCCRKAIRWAGRCAFV